MPAFKQLVSKYPHSSNWLPNLIIETSSFQIPAFEEFVSKYHHSNK